jgi:hypothetical protein
MTTNKDRMILDDQAASAGASHKNAMQPHIPTDIPKTSGNIIPDHGHYQIAQDTAVPPR